MGGHAVRQTRESILLQPVPSRSGGSGTGGSSRLISSVLGVLPLAGELSEGLTEADGRGSRDSHPQAADGLPQAGDQVSSEQPSGSEPG